MANKVVEKAGNGQRSHETISYWTQCLELKDLEVEFTVATTVLGLGWLGFGASEGNERSLQEWAKRWYPNATLTRQFEPNSEALEQLQEYLLGKRKVFTIPLDRKGTAFQCRVWEELERVPFGETRTYGEIAIKVGNPKGQRAVGMANHRNPLAIVVPCHRVIGKNGNLTGYAGGLDIKQRLLELEGAILALISESGENMTGVDKIDNVDNVVNQPLFIGLEHIGIKTLNMDNAIRFYEEVLGFKLLSRIKPQEVELSFMELGGMVIELVGTADGVRYEDGVVNHIAFKITNINKAIEHLKEHQVELISSTPIELENGSTIFFFRGPSGEKLELFQA